MKQITCRGGGGKILPEKGKKFPNRDGEGRLYKVQRNKFFEERPVVAMESFVALRKYK
jgi:hypothetical protein